MIVQMQALLDEVVGEKGWKRWHNQLSGSWNQWEYGVGERCILRRSREGSIEGEEEKRNHSIPSPRSS